MVYTSKVNKSQFFFNIEVLKYSSILGQWWYQLDMSIFKTKMTR